MIAAMSDAEGPVDARADALREASRGADPGLTGELLEAACGDRAGEALEAVLGSALRAGACREDLLKACDAARLVIRTRAGGGRDHDEPAEDRLLDVMDRLTGWCHPDARL